MGYSHLAFSLYVLYATWLRRVQLNYASHSDLRLTTLDLRQNILKIAKQLFDIYKSCLYSLETGYSA